MSEDFYELSIGPESIEKCRSIHREIINFGVSEEEKIKLISLLSFELENINLMRKIQESIKSSKNIHPEENLEESNNLKQKLLIK